MSSTPVALISAASGHFSELGPRSELGRHAGTAVPDPNRAVWAVIFRGTFQGSCGPGLMSPPPQVSPVQHPCPPPNTTVRVVLDYSSGAFITATTPADAP